MAAKRHLTKSPTSTGSMRDFLIEQMVKIAEGKQDHPTAQSICRYAQQVYNLCNLELRAANMMKKRGSIGVKSLEYSNDA